MIILYFSTLLLVSLLTYLAIKNVRLHKKIEGLFYQVQEVERTLRRITQENAALVTADLNFSRQLTDFTQQLISMEHQIQSLANQRNNDGGYQHALRILAMGGDKEEIIRSCHLSPAEAELMINLHAYQTACSVKTKNLMT